MPRRSAYRAIVSPQAETDIAEIQQWSKKTFGEAAAQRYLEFVIQVLRDLEADSDRPGSRLRPDLPGKGLRSYHLALSRDHVVGPRVMHPRHFVIYRKSSDGAIEFVRVLHNSRDLALHLPREDNG